DRPSRTWSVRGSLRGADDDCGLSDKLGRRLAHGLGPIEPSRSTWGRVLSNPFHDRRWSCRLRWLEAAHVGPAENRGCIWNPGVVLATRGIWSSPLYGEDGVLDVSDK